MEDMRGMKERIAMVRKMYRALGMFTVIVKVIETAVKTVQVVQENRRED